MKRNMLALFLASVATAATFCCASLVLAQDTAAKGSAETPAGTSVGQDYIIHEEDVLRMDVWGEPQLSNMQMQVTSDGKINVAVVGVIPAKGLTQAELSKNIADELVKQEILVTPKVVITLISINRPTVRVLGAVQKSGDFEFKEGDRVLDAVAQAGYLPNTALDKTTLTRKDKPREAIDLKAILSGDNTTNIELEKGDIINIPLPYTVRVLGAVSRSGDFQVKEGDRVLDAVAQAGYIPDTSWLAKTTLTRKGKVISVPLDKMLKGEDLSLDENLKNKDEDLAKNNIALENGDIINIPPMDYANKFYVMGQVNRPMMYDLKDKTTVLAAINLAGGVTERGKISSTMVIRGDPKKPEKVNCDIAKFISKGDASGNIELQAGDVVYVPETKTPDLSKISQLISTISSLTYIRKYGLF